MIGSSNFSAFYGNDLTPTTNYSDVSVDQLGDPNVTASTSSIFSDITTDKIPVRINITKDPSDLTSVSFAQEKEPNDTTDAIPSVNSGDIIYVRQGKRLTITLGNDGLADPPVSVLYELRNVLTGSRIAIVTLDLYTSITPA